MRLFLGKLRKYISITLVHLFNCLPIKRNKIFLFSYYGSQYGCNPKYITEYILSHTIPGKYDLVWALNDVKQAKGIPVRIVKTMSIKYFYEMCTSKVIITNYRTTDLFVKRKSQYYIQTWHSSLRLKQIEKDVEKELPKHYVLMARKDSLKCDLLLSGCKYSTEIFRRAFWYEGEIFKHGTPRNDVLIQGNQSNKKDILDKLNINPHHKVVLYAPTFRKDKDVNVYDLHYKNLLDALKKRFGGDWLCLVKLHPHLISYSNQLAFGEQVIDVTEFQDIQQLLSASDLLVTDYSSLMFDFSITGRPCFLYVPDVKEYIERDRKLYFDLTELPFKKAQSNGELLNEIQKFNFKEYEEDLFRFHNKIGSYENGRASEYLLFRMNEICFNESRRESNEAV